MANIPLRTYIREIENLIDRGQTEEAIAHCKHILQVYPKHIDTYRMLGKAYLESQRYTEAADILQRVLSCLPDDFVSQVGMSIIREDEGNLDAAIAHMERAYEVQPSNSAVQEELRRLYGRRDGVEPSRIRLTKGSLARMYARGDLYHQAISEIKNAVAEDPQRLDLQVLLAKMYHLSGQKFEAVDLCNQLIEKYPYCYDANRILSEILPFTNQSEQAEVFKDRMTNLDPYLAHVTSATGFATDVPDSAVVVEHLEWDPSRSDLVTPTWANGAFIVEEQEPEAHRLPDWLASFTPDSEAFKSKVEISDASIQNPAGESIQESSPQPVENVPPQAASDNEESPSGQIPDWMKSVGWTPASSNVEEPPVTNPESEHQEAVASENIPDWLKSLAPDVSSQPFAEAETHTDDLSWLSSISKDLDKPGDNGHETTPPDAFIQGLPDWLNPDLENQPSDDSLEPNEGLDVETGETIKSVNSENPAINTISESISGPEKDETAAWLESIAARHSSEADTILARPEDRMANPPSWFNNDDSSESTDGANGDEQNKQVEETGYDSSVPVDETLQPAQGISEWVREIPENDGVDNQQQASLDAEASDVNVQINDLEPETISQNGTIDDPSLNQPAESPSPAQTQELPDWLKALESQIPTDQDLGTVHDTDVSLVEIPEMPEWAQEPTIDRVSEQQPANAEAQPIGNDHTQSEVSDAVEWYDQTNEESQGNSQPNTAAEPFGLEPSSPSEQPLETPAASANTESSLYTAQMAMLDGNTDAAVEAYQQVIASGQFLDEVIRDLRDAIYRYPINISIWQALGDAYIRVNRVQEALDAYTKAEELIR